MSVVSVMQIHHLANNMKVFEFELILIAILYILEGGDIK